ncbi:MAG: amidohydrolase, partial [Vicinamibacterales bacterium]
MTIRGFAVGVLAMGLSAAQAHGGTPAAAVSTAQIDALYPQLQEVYVDLHRNPELAFQETRTAALLAEKLRALGFEVTTGVGRTGVVAILKNGAGPMVMMRTEIDALPVAEKTGLPFASTVTAQIASGQTVPVMHACGHDLHMTAWLGTATVMAQNRARWRGTLMMVGQPAEESLSGARAMLADGLFTRFPKPDYALSLHDDDTMPAGTIGYRPGLFRAMSDAVTITVYGRGGHSAMPHNTVDPVVLASR